MTEEKKTTIEKLISELKQQRDELRLKMHLGGQELKDEYSKLDDRLNELNQKFKPVKEAVGETAEDVWDAMKLLGGEIKDGFARIYKAF